MNHRIQEYRYATEKGPGYYRAYEKRFSPLRDSPITLLEIGVNHGGCLELWNDFFPNGTIIGLDQKQIEFPHAPETIHCYQGLQENITLLDQIAANHAPQGFDIIIDDASHIAEKTAASFWHLFEHHMKPGGLYIIEDWGTGYWDFWQDGKSYAGKNHTAGMVGLIKEIVDEVGSVDHSCPGNPSFIAKPSRIRSMEIRHGMAFIERSDAP